MRDTQVFDPEGYRLRFWGTSPGMQWHACRGCMIYWSDELYSHCPQCDMRKQLRSLRGERARLESRVGSLQELGARDRLRADDREELRFAYSEIEKGDRDFLVETFAYWRERQGHVTMMPLIDLETDRTTGFVRVQRSPEGVVEYECTSMGGMTLASTYRRVVASHGNIAGMKMLHAEVSKDMAAWPG